MAVAIPVRQMEDAIAALAKIELIHMHISGGGARGLSDASPYFLEPCQINAVSEGDDELWPGTAVYENSSSLRFKVGDSVECLDEAAWSKGYVLRQPRQDGEEEAYEVRLLDGRHVLVENDDDASVRPGSPRPIDRYLLVFQCEQMNAGGPHEQALAVMGDFGRDVQLASAVCPSELAGRMVHQARIRTHTPIR